MKRSIRGLVGQLAGVSCIALAASLILLPSEALARKNSYNSGGGWGWFGYSDYDDEPRYYKPKPRVIKRKAAPKSEEDAVAKVPTVAPYKPDGSPLFLMVSLKKQRITVYDSNGRVAEAPISSGRIGFSTPTGVFTILQKNKVHFSNLYDSAPMPNMQRITWSGVALHAGDLPGYPASHGCIRLPRNFALQLFGMTKLNQRVVVSRDPIEPVPFAHAKMFQSFPPDPLETAAIDKPEARATVHTVSAEATNPGAMTQALEIAAADATPAPVVSPFRAKRQAEKAAADTAFEAAKADKTAREDAAKAAVAEADAAKTGIRAAQVEVAKLEKAVRAAEVERDKGDLQLADYTKKYSGVTNLSAEDQASAAEEEKLLEANALALADGVDAAKRAVAAAAQVVADATKTATDLDQKRRDAIHALSDANVKVRTTGIAVANLKAQEAFRKYPVSVFISRKANRLYVRQNQKPMFDVPVTFASQDQPLGTHVYTALEYANSSKTELRWNAISIAAATAKPDNRSRLEKLKAKVKAEKEQVPAPVETTRQTPQAALERVSIDEATREQIADLMKPGSSVIITDHGISNETGQYTDFIVLTNQ